MQVTVSPPVLVVDRHRSKAFEFVRPAPILGTPDCSTHLDQILTPKIVDLKSGRIPNGQGPIQESGYGRRAPGKCGRAAIAAGSR